MISYKDWKFKLSKKMPFLSFFQNPLFGIFWIVALLVGITIHEYAHAKVADYLGDPTPRAMGRVSLNPLVHLDLYGTLALLFFGFGWGKPVLFDPFNLKKPRRDSALISLAGPVSNLVLAFVVALSSSLLFRFFPVSSFWEMLLSSFSFSMVYLNFVLAFFNLVPIYPLDGFKIVEGFLPEKKAKEWSELRRYGPIFLLLFILPLGGKSLAERTIGPLIGISIDFLDKLF